MRAGQGAGACAGQAAERDVSPRRDLAVRYLELVARLLPGTRADWGRAMRAELDVIDNPAKRRRFALGCTTAIGLPAGLVRPTAAVAAIAGLVALSRVIGLAVPLVLILALLNLALAVVGTLVSALAIRTRARDLIVPIVALPMLVPALIAAARGAAPLLAAGGAGSPPTKWLAVLALYDLVFGLLAYAVFDFLLED